VLRDPRQKRFFKARDIHDLFTLGSQVRYLPLYPPSTYLQNMCLVPPSRLQQADAPRADRSAAHSILPMLPSCDLARTRRRQRRAHTAGKACLTLACGAARAVRGRQRDGGDLRVAAGLGGGAAGRRRRARPRHARRAGRGRGRRGRGRHAGRAPRARLLIRLEFCRLAGCCALLVSRVGGRHALGPRGTHQARLQWARP
jgi:hypothetical protein